MMRKGATKLFICGLMWVTIGLTFLSTGFGANILIICPLPAKSVYTFHVAIARSLHAAGHQITMVHSFPNDAASENLTVINSSLVHRPEFNSFKIDEFPVKTNLLAFMLSLRDWSESYCHHTIQLDQLQKIMHSKDKQFDVMIVDVMEPMYECFLPIAELLDIPIIGACTAKSWWRPDWLVGNLNNPATIPNALTSKPAKMEFMQRLTNLWYWIFEYSFEQLFVYPKLDIIYKKYFPNSSVAQRIKPSLIFASGHQILISRPVVTNVINLGGIHVQSQPAKPLPQHLEKFIDEAENGVILFTFGSLLKMFEEKSSEFQIMKTAFAQIPQRVIWKMEEEVGGLPKNVMTSKWLPQRDILAHKNVVAFITHCGLSGIFEATFEAKPLIMMPICLDQVSNAAILEEIGVGVSLDIRALSVEKVLKALHDIVHDTKYRKQMRNISKIMKDSPMTPEEAVVYWTEYVIRHKGAPHLQTAAASISLPEYLLLDVILFVSGAIVAYGIFLFWCCKKIFNWKTVSHESTDHDPKKS